VLDTFGPKGAPIASLLECALETGRTHQVRVHLSSIGHPLIGDPLYGSGFKSKLRTLPEPLRSKLARLDHQALHAAHLAFLHPRNGTLLKFNSRLPLELAEILESLKEL
jgi:23S rRNA pseudouridine1911/1915/1917 synthase